MKTLKILPQKIFKFKCKPQLLESTLENLKDDEWVEHEGKWATPIDDLDIYWFDMDQDHPCNK